MIYLLPILLTIFFILIFSFLAPYLRLIDMPDKRKLHKGKVPLVGGLSIYLTIIFMIFFIEVDYLIVIILLSSAIILILGALDDAFELGIIIRLISQLIAGLIVVGAGISIVDIGDYYFFPKIQLGTFGILLTIVSVTGLTNAINFIDGIDGLCSGLVLLALITLLFFIYLSGNNIDYSLIGVLSLSITIFLLINMGLTPIKKIFLGDAGSMLLGFILSWFLIYYSHPTIRYIHPVLALWCVPIPIFDLLGVIIRRLMRKINPFKSDRRHIHHILIDLGLSPIKVFLTITISSIIISLIGGIIYFNFGPFPALLSYAILFISYVFVSFSLSRKIYL